MIRVVKVNKLRTPEERAAVVYVGRAFAGWPGSVWRNPFKPGVDGTPGECTEKYVVLIAMRVGSDPDLFEESLTALWEATNHGAKPLGCWCVDAVAGDGSPVVCHAQILAELLLERFVPA